MNKKRSIAIFLRLGIILILSGIIKSASAEIILQRKAIIHNFTKKEYNAANQNWSICQNPDGELFFGNTFGLLRFNGINWTTYQLNDNMTIRSVYADDDGRIYVGGHEEFGYWQYSPKGVLTYYSLSQQLPDTHTFKNEDIWQISKINGRIFFRSFARIYALDGERITVIDPNNAVFSILNINDKPHAFLLTKGIYKIDDQFLLEKDYTLKALDEFNVITTLAMGDSTVFVTEKHGLFLRSDKKLVKWNCKANQLLQYLQVNKAVENSNRIIIGTISDGVFIFSSSGRLLKHLNKKNGLQNNTVLDLFFDANNKLWVALDMGISLIDLDNTASLYEDASGELGAVYAAQQLKGKLYLGTNHGIYQTTWPPLSKDALNMELVPGTQGQCWTIYKANDHLLFGHNSGTFITNGQKLEKISTVAGGANIISHPTNGQLYQGTYIGVAIYEQDQHQGWKFKRMLQNSSIPIRFLQFDYEGNLWASHIYKHLFCYKLNASGDTILSTSTYGKANGFLSDYDINTFKFDKRVVFTNNQRLFTFNYLDQSIIPYTQLEDKLEDFQDTRLIYEIEPDEYWFAKNTGFKGMKLINDSLHLVKRLKYELFNHSSVDLFENISKIDSEHYVFGLEDGFAVYQINNRDTRASSFFKLKVEEVHTIDQGGNKELIPIPGNEKQKIPYAQNTIAFTLSAPGVVSHSVNVFYRLDSLSQWIPIEGNKLFLNNMDCGDYTIQFMAWDDAIQQQSSAQLSFYIAPPLFIHPLAFVLYILIIISITICIRKVISIRLKQQKLLYLKKLKRQNEKQIIKMNNELLQSKVANKSKELANYTMLLKRKNEVLNELRDEIEQLELAKTKNNLLTKAKALKIINNNLSDKNDLEVFNMHFNEGHDNFIKKLRLKHPELTPNDLRLCAFLRMNLMSKEIATLLNLTPRSVEVKRYRLRKKLNLSPENNLTNYLMEL